ncbi:hypothetical protein [Arthrobacter sp. STN4]|uniref:hypothetical protein n=1 Tax=Arthrobacter sp. STN4 TaxID=2923276 RepID=UPI002119D0FE|nr:hypothetical protein [Arthrobacter sp. STN4]MCQ9163992.1 hypothetical protein [Arthrobacter sp. STN4]
MANNLSDGRFRIVLAVDAINPDLKRMVEYLNAMSGPATSIIAVAYARLSDQETDILMPRIYGEELAEAKSAADAGRKPTWTIESFRSWLGTNSPSNLEKFNHFTAQAAASGLTFHGSTSISPTATFAILAPDNTRLGTLSLIAYTGQNTSVELDFYGVSRMEPQQRATIAGLSELPATVAGIPGMERVGERLSATVFANRKNTPLTELPDESIQQLIGVLAALQTQT